MMWFLGLSLISNIVLVYGLRNLLTKFEVLEANNEEFDRYFVDLNAQLTVVLEKIREIDIRGAFEADDEVGYVYAAIRGMISTLNKFLPEPRGESEE